MNKLLNKITKGNLEVVAANANATLKRSNTKVFIKDFELQASMGLYEHERDVPQTIRLNIEAESSIEESFGNIVSINDVVNYEPFIAHARDIVSKGHINLIEDFADRLAGKCFSDPRIESLTIRVEKTTQIKDATATGFEATYTRS